MLKGLSIMANLYALAEADEVAVLPIGKFLATDVIEIASINFVRAFTLQLSNGKLYARTDGRGLVTNDYILPAMAAHREEIERRGSKC